MSPSSRFFRALILSLLSLFLLGACRGVNSGGESNAGNGQQVATTQIRFADAGYKEALYRPLMDAFAAENPGFRIEYVPIEEAEDRRSGVLDFLAQNPFTGRRGEIPGRITSADSSGFWANLGDDVATTYRFALDHAWYASIDGAIATVADVLGSALLTGADAEVAISEITSIAAGILAPFDGGGTRSVQGNRNEMGQVIETGRATIWSENLNTSSGRFGFFWRLF